MSLSGGKYTFFIKPLNFIELIASKGQNVYCIYYVKVLNLLVIISFGDKATEDIYNGVNSRAARSIPQSVWRISCRKLDMLNAAGELRDLKVPPANKLEKLKGKLAGSFSIRINDQYRIIFDWNGQNAENVKITDYH